MNDYRPRQTNRGFALSSPLLLSLMAVGIVFFLLMGFKALKDNAETTEPDLPADATTTQAATEAPSDSLPPDTRPSDAQPSHTQAPEPQSTEPLPTETEAPIVTTTEPAPTEPPQVMMTVDDRYFSDALFIGDSRTDGLRLYSTPGECKFFCATSMNIFTVMEKDITVYGYTGLLNLLKGMEFGKVYIMFGINECGYPTSSFAKTFGQVVATIREYQPNAIIYIQSILYVTQNKENKDPVFATSNLKEKNETLKALANDVDIFYLEVNDALNDGTDHLPSEYTNDGVHLKATYYRLWHDYLLEHAIVDAAHPWEPLTEDTTEPEGAAVEHP